MRIKEEDGKVVKTKSHLFDYKNYPKLWEINVDDKNDECNLTNQPSEHMPSHIISASEESFAWARSVSRVYLQTSYMRNVEEEGRKTQLIKILPYSHCGQYQPFFKIFSSSLVVAQEFALSTLFLVALRCMICDNVTEEGTSYGSHNDEYHENEEQEIFCLPCRDESQTTLSISIFAITLPIITIWATTARRKQRRIGDDDDGDNKIMLARNRERAYYRTIDALYIAAMLRFLSSVLRSLTASYSSDTVMALAVGGMTLHLLSCDYGFANGERKQGIRNEEQNKHGNKNGKSTTDQNGSSHLVDISYKNGRPFFMGGTVSINSVFFSAVLLASRCHSDSTSYFFLMLTVILFAYYPEARYVMALAFGATIVCYNFLTTCALSVSAYLILNNGMEKIIFKFILSSIIFIAPTWRWLLQSKKEIIGGPWEIAHVDTS